MGVPHASGFWMESWRGRMHTHLSPENSGEWGLDPEPTVKAGERCPPGISVDNVEQNAKLDSTNVHQMPPSSF